MGRFLLNCNRAKDIVNGRDRSAQGFQRDNVPGVGAFPLKAKILLGTLP